MGFAQILESYSYHSSEEKYGLVYSFLRVSSCMRWHFIFHRMVKFFDLCYQPSNFLKHLESGLRHFYLESFNFDQDYIQAPLGSFAFDHKDLSFVKVGFQQKQVDCQAFSLKKELYFCYAEIYFCPCFLLDLQLHFDKMLSI